MSVWYLAQTFDERIAALKCAAPMVVTSNKDLAQRRLSRWQSGVFEDETLFDCFLQSKDLSKDEFLALLGQEADHLQKMFSKVPDWLKEFEATINYEDGSRRYQRDRAPGTADEYIALLDPLLARYHNRLHDFASSLSSTAFASSEIVGELAKQLSLRLKRLIQKTMILETNIARLNKRLTGSTPEERFGSYIQLLGEARERIAIFQEYPLLARKCLMIAEQWLEVCKEFLQRLHNDFDLLVEKFNLKRSAVIAISGGAGDMHRQGRSVHILRFESGDRLVYKPRPLTTDVLFQDLVEWLNSQGIDLSSRRAMHGIAPTESGGSVSLPVMKVIDRREYGWSEFVEHSSCMEEIEIDRFYRRQGAWLALLYAIGTTDLHLENLVACGENPYVIDLETIFHPRVSIKDKSQVDEAAIEKFVDSVMAVGLLPTPVHGEGRSMDKSGLGAKPDQLLPFDVDGVKSIGTDEIRIAKVPGRIGRIVSRPLLNGEHVDVCFYRNQIEDGFRKAYRIILQNRETLTRDDGLLSRFKQAPIRVVIRPSSYYANLLNESQHPTFNRNAMDQDLMFKDLWQIVKENQRYSKAIPSELEQLLNGDIPYFSTMPDSHDITGGDGAVVAEFLPQSGYELCLDRLQRMSEEDLDWQIWLIDASLSTMSVSNSMKLRRKGFPRQCENLLDGAIAAGNRLVDTAVRVNGQSSWVCLVYQGGKDLGNDLHHYQIGIIDHDFYRGALGIILFLAYLDLISEKRIYKNVAEESLDLVLHRLNKWRSNQAPGAYTGISGFIYTMLHLHSLWNRTDLLDLACDQLSDLSERIKSDTTIDVIRGCSGAIPVLLHLANLRPQSQAAALARECGERIIELSQQNGSQLSWPQLSMPRGLSHGLSGIAWVLSELYRDSKNEKYKSACFDALAQERVLLAEDWTDIPDNRDGVAWCHGATGIALSRIKIWENTRDETCAKEVKQALDYYLKSPTRTDHLLCHGVIGNLDILQSATEVFASENGWRDQLKIRTEAALADINRNGWGSPLPPQLIEPGLMIGLAGIGYGLLRLAEPQKVPSVLSLSAPNPA